jgi:type IV secretion system protein VirB9
MKIKLLAFGFVLPSIAFSASNQTIANNYFSKDIPHLSTTEQKALKIAKDWQNGKGSGKPFKSSDGAVTFVYGVGQTKIVCAVLQACDIALQAGEKFNDMSVGDPRFLIEPSITGSGANQQIHLIVKPKDVGLDSALVVTTDKRTYHIRLKSTRNDYIPYASFIYPDEALAKWRQVKQIQNYQRQENSFPMTHEYLGDLNFNYRLSGHARWKPIRVYNDGRKTIIEMPGAMKQTQAPALLVLKKNGLFQKDSHIMVNYRIQGSRYIVDNVFDSAVLLAGSGASQQKVTITRC